jgi:nickel superoxide dismutase
MLQTIKTGLITATVLAVGLTAAAHCQIPCGIYDDELRVQLIEEHIGTIEKSMKQIVALGKASPADYNQIVRWVGNKEEHANQIQEIVTQYFLAQRIKVPASPEGEAYSKYQHHLELLHKLLVTAMKAKQGTDLAHVQTMRALIKDFRKTYFDHHH